MKQPETERITPELIEMYRGWAPGAVAAIYDRRLREIESLQAKTFVELGIIIVECVTRESCASLTPLIGKVVRVYLRNKRSLSDGWHCGKLLSVAKGKAVIELRHKTVVAIEDVEGV